MKSTWNNFEFIQFKLLVEKMFWWEKFIKNRKKKINPIRLEKLYYNCGKLFQGSHSFKNMRRIYIPDIQSFRID